MTDLSAQLRSLYQQTIIDHAMSPHHAQPLTAPTITKTAANLACGDNVMLALQLVDDTITAVSITTTGCSLATASGSMLSDILVGKTLPSAQKLAQNFMACLKNQAAVADDDLQDAACLLAANHFAVRVKCVALPWVTLIELINHRKEQKFDATE